MPPSTGDSDRASVGWRLVMLLMLVTVGIAVVGVFVWPPRTVLPGFVFLMVVGLLLTYAVGRPRPMSAVIAAATFDAFAIPFAPIVISGMAIAVLLPFIGCVLLVRSFRGRRLTVGFVLGWASGIIGFALALGIGPASRVTGVFSLPVSVMGASILTGLAYGALWWVADGLRRSTAAAAESSRQERRLAEAVRQAGDVVIVEGANGLIEYVNPAFEEVTGFASADAIGRPLRSLVRSGDHPAAFYAEMDAAIARGEPWTGRITALRRDGTRSTQALKVSPLHDADGRRIGAVRVSRDLTQELELEERLRQAAKMEAVGQLAGGVAHDFNNLLTAITGYAELVQGGLTPGSEASDDIDQVLQAAGRARELTRQLLTFARKSVLEPQVLDPVLVITGFAPMLRRLLGEHIDLVVTDRGGGSIRIDAGQLEQTVLNLAVNARDAMPMGGTLQIEVSSLDLDEAESADRPGTTAGRYICIAVADTGSGMDAATRAHIFEPFFTTKPAGQGTGLGLATVFGIVRMAGGWIDVDSQPGVGTTFRVSFPAVTAAESVAPVAPHAADPVGSERVLLVEDDEAVRAFGQRTLSGLGYRVVVASSGQDALDLVAGGAVADMVVTDVVMPGIQGPELVDRLRESCPDLPALFVSGFADRAAWHTSASEIPGGWLAKPYRRSELAHAVRSELDRDPTPAG